MNVVDRISRKWFGPDPATQAPPPGAAVTITQRQVLFDEIAAAERAITARREVAAQRLAIADDLERRATEILASVRADRGAAEREQLAASLDQSVDVLRSRLRNGAPPELFMLQIGVLALSDRARLMAQVLARPGERNVVTLHRGEEVVSNLAEVERCVALAREIYDQLEGLKLTLDPTVPFELIEVRLEGGLTVAVPIQLAEAFSEISGVAFPLRIMTPGQAREFAWRMERAHEERGIPKR